MRSRNWLLLGLIFLLAACGSALGAEFDGQRALQDVETQLAFGPRTLGSDAHAHTVDWIVDELKAAGWEVEIQETPYNEIVMRNIIAKRGAGHPWVLVGAHYDSRFVADQDPDPKRRGEAVPGANDGASGVAVLLELARVLPEDAPGQVWLAFLDAEDNGNLPGWDWILGSRALANRFQGDVEKPDAVVIVDMIGDRDLQVYREQNSDPALSDQIWAQASALGYEQFIDQPRHRMLDDHIPFIQVGIPAVDLIDFDYPAWHTTGDTLDKVSAESLRAVGHTVQIWLQKFLVGAP